MDKLEKIAVKAIADFFVEKAMDSAKRCHIVTEQEWTDNSIRIVEKAMALVTSDINNLTEKFNAILKGGKFQ
jgi:hypothetical protein